MTDTPTTPKAAAAPAPVRFALSVTVQERSRSAFDNSHAPTTDFVTSSAAAGFCAPEAAWPAGAGGLGACAHAPASEASRTAPMAK